VPRRLTEAGRGLSATLRRPQGASPFSVGSRDGGLEAFGATSVRANGEVRPLLPRVEGAAAADAIEVPDLGLRIGEGDCLGFPGWIADFRKIVRLLQLREGSAVRGNTNARSRGAVARDV